MNGRTISLLLSFDAGIVGAMCQLRTNGESLGSAIDCESFVVTHLLNCA